MDTQNRTQREIKFRVLDYNGQMVFSDKHYEGDLGMFFQQMSPDGEDVMQYIGLKDRNGVEIYEGDIVKYFTNYYGNKKERKKAVEWIDDMQDDSFGEPLSMGYRFHGTEIEVIGNIWENPELLREGK